jgi:DNA-binding MarR family transcriptional regulator
MAVKPAKPSRRKDGNVTKAILHHWREAVPNDRLAHLVRDGARSLVRALQVRLMEHSVPFGHWAFLRILWEADGLTQRELSFLAGLMEPTTFTALKSMEKLGYIRRMQRPDNKKSVYIFLTPKGRQLKSRLVPLAEEVNEIAVRGIAPEDVATTRRTLLAIIENLAAEETAGHTRRLPSTREVARLLQNAS